MFRRRRRGSDQPDQSEPSADGPRDEDLPTLSEPQAVALYGLAARVFAEYGVEVDTDFDGTFHASDGRVFGLHNLAVVVASLPFRDWYGAVDAHVGPLLAAQREHEAAGPDCWLLKLRAFADLPETPDFDATCPLPGIAVLPAVDYPTHVSELFGTEQVRRYAEPDAFRERALANLRALPRPEATILRADDTRPDSEVHVLAVDDFFGAARVLVLDHLLATVLGVERPPHGTLVAVPNRHLLVVHVITGPGVIPALQLVANIARGEFDSRPGPVSEDVFFLPGGGRLGQRLTERDDDGGIRVTVDGPFAEVLQAVGGPDAL